MAGQGLEDLDFALGQLADGGHVLEIEPAVQELHRVLHGDLVVVGVAELGDLGLQVALLLLGRAQALGDAARAGQERAQVALERAKTDIILAEITLLNLMGRNIYKGNTP